VVVKDAEVVGRRAVKFRDEFESRVRPALVPLRVGAT
jgi:hypothetical protein